MAVFTHTTGALTIHLVEAGMANYVYVVEWEGGCLVVDPAEATPVQKLLATRGIEPSAILATHHHADHVGGIPSLKQTYGCKVIGPAGSGIRGLDREVREGEEISVGPLRFQVLETPGHTATDLSFYAAEAGLLFCGDTLFSGGCGRLFECEPGVMWHSLRRLRDLPDPTLVCCGHEYTENNLRFALSVMPDDPAVAQAAREARALRSSGRPTLPGTIGQERCINLFLRAEESGVQAAMGLLDADGGQVFAELRRRKDRF